jgi:hypothetical protein
MKTLNPSIDFSWRERRLLRCNRKRSFMGGVRSVFRATLILVSLGFIFQHLKTGNGRWAVVGYGLLLVTSVWGMWKSCLRLKRMHRIVDKYEARLAELENGSMQNSHP